MHLRLTVLLCLLCAVSFGLNRAYFQQAPAKPERGLYILNDRHAQILGSGFDRAIADLMWMHTIAYFGEHVATDQDYRYLEEMLDTITRLNPKHESAYYMAAVILPWMLHAVDQSNALMIRAMVYLPDDGRWPYYLGFNQYLFRDNAILAKHYVQRAIEKGYINQLSTALAAKLEAKTSNILTARAFLLRSLHQERDKSLRHFLTRELNAVETEIILQRVDRLVKASHMKLTPALLSSLRRRTTWVPDVLPDGGRVIVGNDGRVRSSKRSARYTLHESQKRKTLLERSL